MGKKQEKRVSKFLLSGGGAKKEVGIVTEEVKELMRLMREGICIDCKEKPSLKGSDEYSYPYVRCESCERKMIECKLCGSIDHTTYYHRTMNPEDFK